MEVAQNRPMTTLYHMPLTCSLAVRIAADYGGIALNIIHADTLSRRDYKAINPLGLICSLRTPDGEIITETSAALMWVQSQSADNDFRREPQDADYYQLLRWIAFVATEIHKQIYRMVFYDELDDASKDNIRALAPARFGLLDNHLAQRKFLLGDHFSAADAYLFWATRLAERARVDLTPYQHLNAYAQRVQAIPAIGKTFSDDWERKQAEMQKQTAR